MMATVFLRTMMMPLIGINKKTRQLLRTHPTDDVGYGIFTYDIAVTRCKTEVYVIRIDPPKHSLLLDIPSPEDDGYGIFTVDISKWEDCYLMMRNSPVVVSLVTKHMSFLFFGFQFTQTGYPRSIGWTHAGRFQTMRRINAKEEQKKIQ